MLWGFRNLMRITAVSALVLGVTRPAAAIMMDYTLTFGATDFKDNAPPNPTPPVSLVLGQFSFSLDPTSTTSGAVTTNFLNLVLGSVSFSYFAGTDNLRIGGDVAGVDGIASGTNDVFMEISNFTSAPSFAEFTYTQATSNVGVFTASDRVLHVEAFATAVTPIPAALPLFISALGGLGYLGWRRRKAAA